MHPDTEPDEPMTVRVSISSTSGEVSILTEAPCTPRQWEEMDECQRDAVRDRVVSDAVADGFSIELEVNARPREGE